MGEMYLYSVNPRKVITGLSNGDFIRTPKSILLTKEDVLKCLEYATVYRRFPLVDVDERVTLENIDRIHREKYVSEEDWDKVKVEEASKDHGKVKEVVSKQEEAAGQEVDLKATEETKEEPVEVAEPVKEEVAVEEAVSVEDQDETAEEVESDDEEW